MDIKNLVILTEMVLHKYINDCIRCSGFLFCDIIEKIMDGTKEIVEKFFNSDSVNPKTILDDFELILE